MNKKLYTVLLISIITLLSISSASAWLFGDNEDVKTINFTGNETMVMYGTDTPAGENNEYPLSITKDKESYYMNMYEFEDLITISSNVKKEYNLWLHDKKGVNEFDFEGQPFVAEYKTNQTVGANNNANVITKIMYPNGTEIKYESK